MSLSGCTRKVLLFIATLQLSTYRGEAKRYHLYRPGHEPNACDADYFKMGQWTGRPGSRGEVLVGTSYAFNLIYLHQHPTNCEAAKFLVWIPSHNGIGSNIHVLGMALAHALTLGRVLLISNDGDHPFYDTEYCAPEETYHDCYFEPITNCTKQDAVISAGLTSIHYDSLPEMAYGAPEGAHAESQAQDQSKVKIIKLDGLSLQHHHVPKPFVPFLHNSIIRPKKWYYWWRAVSAAYIVRPNERTLHAIEERKKLIYPSRVVLPGTIAVHVRHGDKWKESELVDDARYIRLVEYLRAEASDELGLTHNIYLSTEDEETVRSFRQFAGWNVSYTHVQRFTDPQFSTVEIADKVGKANEMLNSLVSLDLALQCDAFVITLSSNWCRLIDELRATVRCKADRPLLDAQQDNTMADYDLSWRR